MIWFIDDDAGSPLHGMEFRHYYMAESLLKKSEKSLVISASYSHLFYNLPTIENRPYLFEKVNGIDFLWLKVINYKQGNSKKRILKWFQFALKLFSLPKIITTKPTVIVSSCNAPFLIIPCYYLAKKYNAKFILQVKDIWPLTIMELGGYSKYNPLIYIMQKSINFAFKNADVVISVLPYLDKYIEEQGIKRDKIEYLPNGISIKEVENALPLNDKTTSQIPSNKFIVGYAGAMGIGDGLDMLIKSASLLQNYSHIHMVLVGKGAYKKTLEIMVKELKLNNVSIIDPIPKREVQSLLKYFNICYIGWRDKAIYKYGISANKIFDYMYAKKPILHLYSGAGDLVSDAKCGITVTKQSEKYLAKALLKLYYISQRERDAMGNRGYIFVKNNHSYRAITDRFLAICQKPSFVSYSTQFAHK
jgi:glycosyltransferase involved in cell wall biosynthesis